MTILTQETPKAQYQPIQLRENDKLFESGYRCYVRDDSTLFVRKPAGTHYVVDPYEDTCTCPARVRCKHRRFLCELVFLSAAAMEAVGKCEAAKRLWEFWGEFTMTRGKRQ